ncbi:thioesterase II family protein [Dactylosporangium sp. CA-139114]|uniref:thioesterase II family protein n=1 Tax=Dactylosporangium sp. CA-139114 TaxID=3239931 RepID=UPI003D98CC73
MTAALAGRRWLIRDPDPDAPARLLCLPVSGLGAALFRHWPTRVGEIDVCPVQLPGRENRMREPAYTSMDAFAAGGADALEPLLDRPYAFFGHCLGARMSYALTREIAARGRRLPERLFVSSCLAPHRGGRFGGGPSGPFTPETTDEEYFAELRLGCRLRDEPEPPDELLALSVRVLRPDIELTCAYVPPPPVGPADPALRITTIGWSADPHVRPEQMGEWTRYGAVDPIVLEGDEYTYRQGGDDLLEVIAEGFPT